MVRTNTVVLPGLVYGAAYVGLDNEGAGADLARHLIERGLQAGPAFKPILDECFEAQLDGLFDDLPGGLAHLSQVLAKESPD